MYKIVLILLFILSCSQPSKEESKSTNNNSSSFSFTVNTSRIDVTSFKVLVTTSASDNVTADELSVTLTQGSSSAWSETTDNVFETTVSSALSSGELEYSISLRGKSYKRVAVILPTVNAMWDQPEAVAGDVNTDGWEDSPEISPDGKYLIVSTYSPVSILQCILDGTLATDASCNNNSFSLYESQRPNMPYASRILSDSSINHSNGLYDPPDTTNASPPVSSYVFKRQTDGTFKVVGPLYMDWSGSIWGLPFGFTFRRNISGSTYELYYSLGDPIVGNGNQLQKSNIDLSKSTNLLGTITNSGGTYIRTGWQPSVLSISGLTNQAGNPATTLYDSSADGFIFWDDESRSSGSRELYFTSESSVGVFGSKGQLGLGNSGTDKYQPHFFQDSLYYSLVHGLIVSKPIVSTTDLSQEASFGPLVLHLGVQGSHSHVGRVTAIGEPSLAVIDGVTWMYFAYSIQGTGAVDLNIARVRLK